MRLRAVGGSFAHRPRLLAAIGIAILVTVLPIHENVVTRILIGWDAGILAFLGLAAAMMSRSDHGAMQARADREDPGAIAVLGVAVCGSIASFAAIAAELYTAGTAAAGSQAGRLAFAGATVLLSWLFVHTMFALHYAHEFYAGQDDRRGLRFPGEEQPDYWDFAYFAFNLGAAAQTSDVAIEARRTRRLVLAHTVVSFLFNTTILALAINVAAGLFGRGS